MGKKYTQAQRAAAERYMKERHTIRVVVPKEKAAEYKAAAEAEGKSLNKFIIDCLEKEMSANK